MMWYNRTNLLLRCANIQERDPSKRGAKMFSIISEKRCSKCGELKSITEFRKDKYRKGGYGSCCKACHLKDTRAWKQSNKQHYLEKSRESSREYYQKNKEKKKESVRRHYWDNIKNGIERWNKETREKALLRVKRWRTANPEKYHQICKNRKAHKKASNGKITAAEWLSLKERYNYTCLCCKRREPEIKLTLDHVIPLKLGGENVIQNAQPLCISCNSRKNAKIVDYR